MYVLLHYDTCVTLYLSGAVVMTSRSPLHHVTPDDDVIVTSSSPGTAEAAGIKTPVGGRATVNPLSMGYVTAALVLGLLCVVLGVVYGYIHFTRVNPRLRVVDHTARNDLHTASTHIFLRNSKSMQVL